VSTLCFHKAEHGFYWVVSYRREGTPAETTLGQFRTTHAADDVAKRTTKDGWNHNLKADGTLQRPEERLGHFLARENPEGRWGGGVGGGRIKSFFLHLLHPLPHSTWTERAHKVLAPPNDQGPNCESIYKFNYFQAMTHKTEVKDGNDLRS